MPDWKNRIVGYGEEAPDQLMANPRNARIHPGFQQEVLRGVLNEVGWVQNIIVNRVSGTVVDGHLRVALALRHDQSIVPVTYVELSDEEEAEIIATLDPVAALAAYDGEKLAELLADVKTNEENVQAMLDNLKDEWLDKYGDLLKDKEFKEYDESVEKDVKYITCPRCGHKWPM